LSGVNVEIAKVGAKQRRVEELRLLESVEILARTLGFQRSKAQTHFLVRLIEKSLVGEGSEKDMSGRGQHLATGLQEPITSLNK
jgi:hypothetical protein